MQNNELTEVKSVKKNLQYFNFTIGIFHLVEAFIMFLFSSQFKVTITGTYLNYFKDQNLVAPLVNDLFEIKLGVLVTIFLAISAFTHLLIALPGINKHYFDNLKNKINPIRWVEFSVTASLMSCIIAILAGMFDFVSLILVFTISASAMLSGYIVELTNGFSSKIAFKTFLLGGLFASIPWIVTFMYILGARNNSLESIHTLVYVVFFSIFGLFFTLSNQQLFSYKANRSMEKLYVR